jgi:hypothetical protein
MQLPIAEYVNILGSSITFDLFLIGENNFDLDKNLNFSIPYFNKIKKINTVRNSKFSRIVNELLLIQPYYSEYDFEDFDISSYDSVWFSNAKIASLAKKRMFNKSNLVLTTHDAIYYSYYERLKFSILKNNTFSFKNIFNVFRLLFILLNERSYLKRFDSIQVQTNLEKNRLALITNKRLNDKIHVIPNGIKEELISFVPELNTNNILYMSHMILGKEKEVNSFLLNIWTKVSEFNPDLNLFIVGALPSDFNFYFYSRYKNVHFVGFVESMTDIFIEKSLTIIPNYQSSGLINRLYDTICAGVPFVISDKIAQTNDCIKELQLGEIASNDREFINSILKMFEHRHLLEVYSKNAKMYCNQLNSWENSAKLLSRLF